MQTLVSYNKSDGVYVDYVLMSQDYAGFFILAYSIAIGGYIIFELPLANLWLG